MYQRTAALELLHAGKVRDTYAVPDYPDLLLMVASDRMSTHDVVHQTPFILKGEFLTAQTVFFATQILVDIPTHIVASGECIWKYLDRKKVPEAYEKRALIVRKLALPPIEFIFRRYLAGSLHRQLQKGTDPYGHGLEPELPLMHRFHQPLFTPTEKSATDDPLHAELVREEYEDAHFLVLHMFEQAEDYLATRGLVLIDTKAEATEFMLADEFLTGDCSRITAKEDVHEGVEPPFLDKEPVRKLAVQKWAGGPKVPLSFSFSDVATCMQAYHRGFERITDYSLADFQRAGCLDYLDEDA